MIVTAACADNLHDCITHERSVADLRMLLAGHEVAPCDAAAASCSQTHAGSRRPDHVGSWLRRRQRAPLSRQRSRPGPSDFPRNHASGARLVKVKQKDLERPRSC